jgi:neutral ceramidase
VLGRNPAGANDPEVQVLSVLGAETGERLAVVFAYATHSTALGPRNLQITGDIHGLAGQFIENHFGQGVVAPAFAGASADIDPWVRVLPKFETTDGWIPEPVLMSTMLAQEVVTVSKGIRDYSTNAPINTAMTTMTLPGRARERVGEAPSEVEPVPLTITVARLGDVAFVGLGAEVFNEIGRAIKNASPFQHTVIITHCNGGSGYLPNSAAYEGGGYELESSRFAPGAAELAIEEAVRMLREL